jgi:putative addiction module component (TIGR02574 family)
MAFPKSDEKPKANSSIRWGTKNVTISHRAESFSADERSEIGRHQTSGANMDNSPDIFKAAITLPDAERVQLIEVLFATFDSSTVDRDAVADEWRQVAVARAAELDSGGVKTIPWDDVRREGEQRIHDRLSH